MPKFESFEEFWPHYVREHSSAANRRLHFVGTSAALGCIGLAVLRGKPSWLLAAPLVGYGCAWIGHFFFERNTPATFQHPLWSLRGDLRMVARMWAGTMEGEVERACADEAPEGKSNGAGGPRVHFDMPRHEAPADPHSIN